MSGWKTERAYASDTDKPMAVIVAECFLILTLSIYFAKILVLSYALLGQDATVHGAVTMNLLIMVAELAMMFFTLETMLWLSSRRPKGWKKAVRGAYILLAFSLAGAYLGMFSPSSAVTINPVVAIPTVVCVVALMFLPKVREYYTPPMEKTLPLRYWIKFSLAADLYPTGKYRISYGDGKE